MEYYWEKMEEEVSLKEKRPRENDYEDKALPISKKNKRQIVVHERRKEIMTMEKRKHDDNHNISNEHKRSKLNKSLENEGNVTKNPVRREEK